MKDTSFNKGIADLRNIRLSRKERAAILRAVFYEEAPANAWSLRGLLLRARQRVAFAFALAALVVFAGTGTVALAAEGALPGDLLYPVKVKVLEPARDRLYAVAEEKAAWEGEKAARRLREAATLALEGRLTKETSQAIEEKLAEHQEAFRAAAESISTTTEPKKRERVEVEYELKLKAHTKILDKIRERSSADIQDTVARIEGLLDEEVERNERRETEREREKEEREREREEAEDVREKSEEDGEAARERIERVEETVERAARVIQEERESLREKAEDVRSEMLKESERVLEKTKERLRKARDEREHGRDKDADKNVFDDLEDSEREMTEARTVLEEMRKIKVEKWKKRGPAEWKEQKGDERDRREDKE